MTRYIFIGLSLMWMTVFYQNCSPLKSETASSKDKLAKDEFGK